MRGPLVLIVGIAVFLTVAVADSIPVDAGDNEDAGAEFLKCFHPLGKFRAITVSQEYRNARGYRVRDGQIEFLGGFTDTRYYMKFTQYIRTVDGQNEIAIVPGEDTSPIPPQKDCRLRSWNELR